MCVVHSIQRHCHGMAVAVNSVMRNFIFIKYCVAICFHYMTHTAHSQEQHQSDRKSKGKEKRERGRESLCIFKWIQPSYTSAEYGTCSSWEGGKAHFHFHTSCTAYHFARNAETSSHRNNVYTLNVLSMAVFWAPFQNVRIGMQCGRRAKEMAMSSSPSMSDSESERTGEWFNLNLPLCHSI